MDKKAEAKYSLSNANDEYNYEGNPAFCMLDWRKKTRPESSSPAGSYGTPAKDLGLTTHSTRPKFCSNCGKPVRETHKYCAHCGSKVVYTFKKEGRNPRVSITDEAFGISKHITDRTVKYLTACYEESNLGFFSFIWNAFYFTIAEPLKQNNLQNEVVKNFIDDAMLLYGISSDRSETRKFMYALHDAIQKELISKGFPTDEKGHLIVIHEYALVLAREANFYCEPFVPDSSVRSHFVISANHVKSYVESLL